MLRLPQFEVESPDTIEGVVEALQRRPGARLIAGGTDILPNLKHFLDTPPALISLPRMAALRGVVRDSRRARIAALVAPLYADFVQILWCRYSPNTGFEWVRLDAIHRASDAPRAGQLAEGVVLESTPLKLVVEELALAILAQRRHGFEIPASMVNFANLFDAKIDADTNS